MRTRTTWTKPEGSETPRQAATQRHADIYTMNQEHPQPSATDYESGDPDSWAETPTTNKNVEAEYEGDHVKRNELGFGEFRDDTWKHKDSDKWNDGKKYDNKTAAERKASAAERVARAILRTSDDELVREAAIDLMALPGQVLASTLRRMDKVSPDALPPTAKHRRAYACTKLAARLLGEAATEEFVERLAMTFMTVDDPTLRTVLQTVAAAQAAANKRVAQEEDKDEKKGDTAQVQVQAQEEDDDKGGDTAGVQVQAQEEEGKDDKGEQVAQEEEQEESTTSQEEQEAHGLSPQEMGMLDQMLTNEMGECQPAGAPAGGDDLMAIFTPPAAASPMPAAPMPAPAPMAPAMASQLPEGFDTSGITFDDEDDVTPGEINTASVADLFSDDPEVLAQRQIRQAHHEQVQRVAAGYQGIGRTASATGTKKVGKVQPAKPTPAQQLENLWDRQ